MKGYLDDELECLRDAGVPQDSEMLGQEDKMGEVIDARPDRFLREIREHGDWVRAIDRAGMASEEIESLCASNRGFDLAVVECQLQYVEETLTGTVEKAIADLRAARITKLAKIKETTMREFFKRHGGMA